MSYLNQQVGCFEWIYLIFIMRQEAYSSMGDEIRYRLKKSDYYDILDLGKVSSSEDVKKAYKKLALRFHPDKNTTQGAKQVFNKITGAYTYLSNSLNKAEYDQKYNKKNKGSAYSSKPFSGFEKNGYYPFGSQQRFSQFGKFYRAEKNRQREQEQKKKKEFQQRTEEMQRQFAKLFSRMFTNSRNQQTKDQDPKQRAKQQFQKNQQKENIQRMKKQYQQQRRAEERKQRIAKEEQKKKNLMIFFVILFAAILIGPSLVDLLTSKPLYSFARTSQYRFERKTELLQFSYFVNDKYFGSDVTPELKIKIDETIDRKYLLNLKKQCLIVRKQKKTFEEKALKEKAGPLKKFYMQKSNEVNDQSCQILSNIGVQHADYVRAVIK